MYRIGSAPFLECSTRGERRLSAFCARPPSLAGLSIEEAYQAAKVFPDGTTGLSWRAAKGRSCVNRAEVVALYDDLWAEYLAANPDLIGLVLRHSGLSDMFGKPGSVCQAEVIWRLTRKT